MARTKQTRRIAPAPPQLPPVIVNNGMIAYCEFLKACHLGDAEMYDSLSIKEARFHLASTSLGSVGWAHEFMRLAYHEVRKSELFKLLPAELVKKIVCDVNAVA